jgi:hypothetical protein
MLCSFMRNGGMVYVLEAMGLADQGNATAYIMIDYVI